jgi:hypothetical protein
MKTNIISAALLLLLISCNKKSEVDTVTIGTGRTAPAEVIREKECYQLISNKDTVMLSIVQNADNVNGELVYKLYEKDNNKGTISGIFIGDTLFADYTFKSEGMTSVREAVFVKKGDSLLQGSGEMEEKNNKQCFKQPKALKFENATALTKTNCQ